MMLYLKIKIARDEVVEGGRRDVSCRQQAVLEVVGALFKGDSLGIVALDDYEPEHKATDHVCDQPPTRIGHIGEPSDIFDNKT